MRFYQLQTVSTEDKIADQYFTTKARAVTEFNKAIKDRAEGTFWITLNAIDLVTVPTKELLLRVLNGYSYIRKAEQLREWDGSD